MFKSALFVVTRPVPQLRSQIPLYLSEISRLVTESAYIHIQPNAFGSEKKDFQLLPVPFTTEIRNIIKEFYTSSSRNCNNIDIRVLLGHFTNSGHKVKNYNFKRPCDIILLDQDLIKDRKHQDSLFNSISNVFCINQSAGLQTIMVEDTYNDDATTNPEASGKDETILEQYPHTVLGGTFDRLHTGHKLLLSEGCCLGTEKLTVGVTDGAMNIKKTLPELMEPIDHRKAIVEDFLKEVKPGITYNVVTITDGFGPTIHDPDMDLIVLSQETRKGGEMINTEREKKGFRPLLDYTIDLIADQCHNQYEEEKISSSSQRKRLLGTLFHPLKSKDLPEIPYIIGLTGGIASGKSSVCERLRKLGAKIVDCDKLGHQAYVKGTEGFNKVVTAFGAEIVGEDGEVNRKALGKIVFGNKGELDRLNQLVWPEIARLAQNQIQQFVQEGSDIVILDAAVLLEAGWDTMCHEVWTTIVPKSEAIKRIVERNQLSEEQAEQRVNSQISNQERVNQSNVVLCTLWEYEYTQQQVEKAWQLLQKRIPVRSNTDGSKTKSNI